MAVALAVAAAALTSGLRMRSARRRGLPRRPGERARHLWRAKTALVMIGLGAPLGLASAVWLRGMDPLRSAHALAAGLALALFSATGVLGLRMERGALEHRETHALLALASLLAAAAALGTGFVLMP